MKKFIYWSLFLFFTVAGINSQSNAATLPIYYPHTIRILDEMGYNVSKIWVDDYLAIPR